MRLQSDGGGEYANTKFADYLSSAGIEQYVTNADEPRQNGLSERYGRSIQETGLSMLKHSKLGSGLWPYAMKTACRVLNCLPTSALNQKSPHEVWTGEIPDLSNIRTFGVDAWVRVIAPGKGADKAHFCTFLGYRDGLKGFIFQNKKTKQILKSGDAAFYEGDWLVNGIQRVTPTSNGEILWTHVCHTRYANHLFDKNDRARVMLPSRDRVTSTKRVRFEDETTNDEEVQEKENEEDVNEDEAEVKEDEEKVKEEDDEEEVGDEEQWHDAHEEPVRRSSRVSRPPDRFNDYIMAARAARLSDKDCRKLKRMQRNIDQAFLTFDHCLVSTPVAADNIATPTTYQEALKSAQSREWTKAMAEELDSLKENETWSERPVELPPGRKCVNTKWVFKIKRDQNGVIKRYKARLVARGFTQKKGVDYDKTFAPVLQPALLRSLMAIAAEEDWHIHQVNIKTAFLYGKLEEQVFIELPDGTIRQLRRAIYGLKQAGRQWYGRFHDSLIRFGLIRSQGDPCCYLKPAVDGGSPLFAMIHVDDAIIFGNDIEDVNALKAALKAEYKVSDLGEIKHCLGWEIQRDRSKRILTINQRQYIKDILKQHGMENCNVVSTPACPNISFSKGMCPQTEAQRNEMQNKPYLQVLGSLLYLATCTGPDISMAVSELARFAHDPGAEHWTGLNEFSDT